LPFSQHTQHAKQSVVFVIGAASGDQLDRKRVLVETIFRDGVVELEINAVRGSLL
jgi:hypothetical protein